MTSPGPRYSAGTAILDVVPVFEGVQEAIGRQVRKMEGALGKEAGKEFGEKFEDSAVKAVDKALGTTKAKAKKTGAEAAEEYAGQFAEKFRNTITRMNREMKALKFDVQFDDKKLQNQFNAVRRDLEDLSKRKIGVDVDAGPAMIELERIDKTLGNLQDKSIDLDLRSNIGAARAQVEGFRREVQRLGALTVEPEIKVDRQLGLFERALRKRLDAALGNFPPIEFDADVTPAQNRLMWLRQQILDLEGRRIGVDLDASEALAELERLRRELATLATDENVDVDVRVNSAAAATELLGIRTLAKLVDDTKVEIEVEVDSKTAAAALTGFDRFRSKLLGAKADGEDAANSFRAFNAVILGVATVVPAAVPAITALAGGLLLLGPAALGAAAGLGVLGIGFSGIGDVVDALGKVQDNAGKDAEAYAKKVDAASRTVEGAQRSLSRAEQDAARSIEDARRAVDDARQNAADVAEQSAERIADAIENQQDAEEALADAQERVQQAQEDLTQARRDAIEVQEDLALRQRDAVLDEEKAEITLLKERESLRKLMEGGQGERTDLEWEIAVRTANYDVDKAIYDADKAREAQGDYNAELEEFARTGVEGTDRVIDARQRLADAQEGVVDAQERVQDAVAAVARAVRDGERAQAEAAQRIADAVANQARVQQDAAQSIQDAQRNLTQAQKDYTAATQETSTSVQALETAMGKLGPAGQEFALFWFGLMPLFREFRDMVQAGMFPGLQQAISDILTVNGPMLATFMTNMGQVLGDLFAEFGDMMTSPQWQGIWATFSEYAPRFMEQFGQVGLAMLTFFGELFQGLAPYSERFGDALVRLAQGSADWMATFTESQTFRDIMEWLFTNGPVVFDAIWDIARAIGNIFVALEPLGMLILGALDGIAEWIADMDPETLGAIVTGFLGLVIAFQLATGAAALLIGVGTILDTTLSKWIFVAGAVVTAFIILYTQSETFRDIVNGVFQAVGAVIEWFWTSVVQPVFGWILDGWNWLVEQFSGGGDEMNVIFGAIGDFFSYVWNEIIKPIFDVWQIVWGVLWGFMSDLWEGTGKPLFNALWQIVQDVWDIVGPIFQLIGLAFAALWDFAVTTWNLVGKPLFDAMVAITKWLWENVFDPVFGFIADKFESTMAFFLLIWESVGKPVFDFVEAVVKSLVAIFTGNFDQLKGIWGDFWDSLKNAAARPVNFVIHFVLNEGLFDAFNWVIDTLGLNAEWKIKHWGQVGDPSTHYAAGGKVAGWSPNDKADNIPAMLTAGEYVHPVASVDYYGADFMEAIRKRRIPREALGFEPIYRAEGGPVFRQLYAAVKKKFPRAKENSGYRPGDPGLHGAGLAVDLGEQGFPGGSGRPYLAAMNRALYDTAKPFIAELIYTGAGDDRPDIKNGNDLRYSAGVVNTHRNHVHLGVRNLAGFLAAFGSGEGNFFSNLWDSVTGKVAGLWDSVTGVFTSIKDSITKPLGDFKSEFGENNLTKIVSALPGKAVDWVWEKIKSGVSSVFDMFSQQDAYTAEMPHTGGPVRDIVQSVAAERGWGSGAEWNALSRLIEKESSWNPNAQNPTSTAYGLFQFLNSTWGGVGARKTSDPQAQTVAGLNYITQRYGTPSAALAFHNRNNWYSEGGPVAAEQPAMAPTLYDTGGWLPPGVTTVLNATNKPEPILTGDQWDELTKSRAGGDGYNGPLMEANFHGVDMDQAGEIWSEFHHGLRTLRTSGKYAKQMVGN